MYGPQVVARRVDARRERVVVARAGGVQDAKRRRAEGLDGGLVDRARAERPAEDEHARLVLAQAEPRAAPRPDRRETARPGVR